MPFYKQCSELFKNKFLPYLNKQGIGYKANKSELSICFNNGSILQFQSAENYQSLRSATLDYLFLDEVAFMRPEVFEYALFPMMTAKGRKTYMWSTPRGKNHFYNFYMRGVDGVAGWLSFTGHYKDCDNQRQIDIIENMKLTMLPDAFRQEYDAEFVDKSGQVFKDIQNAFTLSGFAQPTERNFGGIDIGMDKDRTVITIVNERCEVIYYKRYELNEQSDTDYLVNSLSEILLMFPNVKCFVEKNFNPAVFQLLRKRNPNVYFFNTNNESKKELITNLQYYISAGLLSSPNIPIMVDEMLSYELGTTKVRNSFTFNAPAGGHDDTIISIALACLLHRNLMKGLAA